MDGKYLDIAGSHVTARVLQVSGACGNPLCILLCLCLCTGFNSVDHHFFSQTCVKWCSQSERDAIFDELQPHLLTLSRKKYAVFLVKKLVELGKFRFNSVNLA
jgi:pumilio family protein 6